MPPVMSVFWWHQPHSAMIAIVLPGLLSFNEAGLIGGQELRIRWYGEPAAVATPPAPMVLNCAGPLAVPAGLQIQGWCHSDRHQLFNVLYPSAVHAVVLEVAQQRIKALVSAQNEALRIGGSLKGAPKFKGYVEVQGVLASPRNLQEDHSTEPVGRSRFPGRLGRVLICSYEDDGPKALVQR